MKFKNKKRAYTLAEIMLVILVLAIIFAAMAPIFTKRKITQYTGKYNVWSYSDRVSFDAFYNPGDPSYTGELFFGVTPRNAAAVTTTLAPLSKIVVRAGEVTSDKKLQRHIQFRYGRSASDKSGSFAGSWYVNRKNMLLGGSYNNLNSNESIGARDNVTVGYSALDKLTSGKNNVAVGKSALSNLTSNSNNVAVGHLASSSNSSGSKNVFIGAMANYGGNANNSVGIGYNAGLKVSGTQNLYVGANSGGGTVSGATSSGSYNTAIGTGTLKNLTTGGNNIAIGYNALHELTTGSNNIAIGYNACSYLTTQSKKTCIGYNSGPKPKDKKEQRQSGGYNATNNGSHFLLWNSNGAAIEDDVERVYIGGSPRNYGGDAILEIHNPTTSTNELTENTASKSTGNTTTIINGNLIVRGRPFFTVGNTLHHFHNKLQSDTNKKSAEYYYRWYGYKSSSDSLRHSSFSGDLQNYQLSNGFPGMSASASSSSGSSGSGGGGGCINNDLIQDMTGPNDDNDKQQHLSIQLCSDRRLKNIGEKFTGGLNEINQLKVYNFTFKNDDKKTPQVGVMAQDLQTVFPNAVFKDENGYLKIRWDDMFYAVINAIKELDQKIISLTKRTIKVETKISKLENENIELKSQIESLTARVNKLKAQ